MPSSKKAAANANHSGGRLETLAHRLIVEVCDEILAGQHHDMFPLHVWMTGSGTQFNMNVNEVNFQPLLPARRHAARQQDAGSSQRSRSTCRQSSNDSFPSAMYIAGRGQYRAAADSDGAGTA